MSPDVFPVVASCDRSLAEPEALHVQLGLLTMTGRADWDR